MEVATGKLTDTNNEELAANKKIFAIHIASKKQKPKMRAIMGIIAMDSAIDANVM